MQLDCINPWFANIVNYLVASILPPEASISYKDKIKSDAKYYVIRRCILDHEIQSVLHFCHSTSIGGHYGSHQTMISHILYTSQGLKIGVSLDRGGTGLGFGKLEAVGGDRSFDSVTSESALSRDRVGFVSIETKSERNQLHIDAMMYQPWCPQYPEWDGAWSYENYPSKLTIVLSEFYDFASNTHHFDNGESTASRGTNGIVVADNQRFE
ncbi:hypothetical protein CR513_10376, partial [Mucuna pruriens]